MFTVCYRFKAKQTCNSVINIYFDKNTSYTISENINVCIYGNVNVSLQNFT